MLCSTATASVFIKNLSWSLVSGLARLLSTWLWVMVCVSLSSGAAVMSTPDTAEEASRHMWTLMLMSPFVRGTSLLLVLAVSSLCLVLVSLSSLSSLLPAFVLLSSIVAMVGYSC